MTPLKLALPLLSLTFLIISCNGTRENNAAIISDTMMVRIAEIEVDSSSVEEYIAILKEEAAASVRLEPGVVSIFPMFEKEHPTKIRILEIYASKAAYESHLKTPHFQKYKTSTLEMVKDLKLIEMEAIDTETMSAIFDKLR
jgi:quinol monooxygenase YgiN